MLGSINLISMKKKMPRRQVTEVVIQETSDIANLVTDAHGRLVPRSSAGKEVKNAQYASAVYLRPSGKLKFLRSIAIPYDVAGPVNPWKLHDLLIFADTSSLTHKSIKLFACSSSVATWQDETRRFLNVQPQEVLVGLCSANTNPERLGWADIIDRVAEAELADENTKVLIVVDSDKNLIPAINSREEELIPGYWLPKNHEIAFATADVGGSWINQEMRRRDKVGKRVLYAITRDQIVLKLLQTSQKVYLKNQFENSNVRTAG